MQKKLIALAVAGLASTAAFAQSNVTIYGVADVYAGFGRASGNANNTSINSGGLSGSRLGFKGTEDLGNGLKALFTLEYGLTVDGNTGVGAGTNARQQFVGLTGGFGTVVAGRLQTAGYDFAAATNALHGTAINNLGTVVGGFNQATLIGSGSRASNAFAYISPEYYGVTFAYNHARLTEAAATGGNETDSTANLYSATYKNGPLTVAGIATYATAVAAGVGTKTNEWAVGAGYDFGVVNLKGSYQRQKVDNRDGDDSAWQLSAIVPVTAAGKVVVGYAQNKLDTRAAGAVNNSNDSKSWTLAYLHSLSKRTTAYAGFQTVSNESDATNGGGVLGTALQAPISTPALNGGGSAKAYVFGVNHSF